MELARSRSEASLPHAYNLRQYSLGRRRIAPAPCAAAARVSHPLSQVDLAGGNGRWRQRRAKEQWVLDQAEAERRRREFQLLEDEKRRRREEREARRRERQELEEQRARLIEERERRERLAQEEMERQEEEERRLVALREQREWLARQPRTCAACAGSGECAGCGGKGFFFATFLAPSVGLDATLDFGRAPQGCPECGGCAQNIRGDLLRGSGRCTGCDGEGAVTPEEVFVERQRSSTLVPKSMTRSMSITVGRKTLTAQRGDLPVDAGPAHGLGLRSPAPAESGRSPARGLRTPVAAEDSRAPGVPGP